MFAVLKAQGWAVELSAGESGMSFSAASLFSVNIVLTDEGELGGVFIVAYGSGHPAAAAVMPCASLL